MSTTLEKMVAPLTPAVFASSYARSPLFFPHLPGRLAELGLDLPWMDMLPEFVARCSLVKAVWIDDRGGHVEKRVASWGEVKQLGDVSACLAAVDMQEPRVDETLSSLCTDLALSRDQAQANLYYSPRTSGMPKHFDNREVYVLQLVGQKRWLVAPNYELEFPLENFVPASCGEDSGKPPSLLDASRGMSRNMPEESAIFVLGAGAALFLPRGTWHATEALEDSLSLTIGLRSPTRADVVMSLLQKKLHLEAHWRVPVPPSNLQRQATVKALASVEHLLLELRKLVSEEGVTEALRHALRE